MPPELLQLAPHSTSPVALVTSRMLPLLALQHPAWPLLGLEVGTPPEGTAQSGFALGRLLSPARVAVLPMKEV